MDKPNSLKSFGQRLREDKEVRSSQARQGTPAAELPLLSSDTAAQESEARASDHCGFSTPPTVSKTEGRVGRGQGVRETEEGDLLPPIQSTTLFQFTTALPPESH